MSEPEVDPQAADRAIYEEIKAKGQPEAAAPAEEPAETTETPVLPDDFEQRLRWDNQDQESIDFWKSRPHDQVTRYYESVKERQERTDALFRQRRELERARAQQTETVEPKVEPQPERKRLQDLLGDDADLLDPKVVEALEAKFDELYTPPPAPVEQQPNQVQRDPEREQRVAAEVEANRVRLQGMFPHNRLDGAEWDDLVSKASVEAEQYHGMQLSPEEAARITQRIFDSVAVSRYGLPTPPPAMQETTNPSGPVTRNSAAASAASNGAPKELSQKDRERIMYEHLARNPGDADGARMAAGLEPLNRHPRFSRQRR